MGNGRTEPVWDVAIVGAGPAGASAALSALYERPDAGVLLLDREDFPRDKACGDGIAPHVLDVLASVGVAGTEAGYAGVERLRIGFAAGPQVTGSMARAAYVIPRAVFDARLVQAALQRGAQLRRHRVRTLVDEGDHVVLDGTIRARLVIAADGASSVVRRQVAPPRTRATAWPGSAHVALAIRGYAPVPPSRSDQQVIVFADPGRRGRTAIWPAYAWSFPIGDGRANVGYGELVARAAPLSREHLLQRLEELLPGAGIDAESWRAHLLPLSTGRPRQPDGRVLFAGDAMSLINPVTGEGIFYAVTSGVLAGRAAMTDSDDGPAVRSGDLRDARGSDQPERTCRSMLRHAPRLGPLHGNPGRAYRSLLRKALAVHLRNTDAATMLARSPAVVAAAVRAADRRPGVFDDLVELGLGDGRLTRSTLRGIAASLRR